MKAEIHSGWGAIEHNGETYDVQDGTLEADETVINALHERYGEKVKPLDEPAENVESVEEPDYAEMDYSELRQLAVEADTDEIDGRSKKSEIISYFTEE